MAYPPPQSGYGQAYGQPQSQSPYPQYQGYNPSFPPPQSHSPYPQHPSYGPIPPNQGPFQGYPQQGRHNQPPPQQPYGGAAYGGASPQPYGAPPNIASPYGAPPNAASPYGAPPYGGPPNGAPPYGGPPQQPYGAPPTMPTPPTSGYTPTQYPQSDLASTADALRKAMKGIGTDEAILIGLLAHIPATEVSHLKQTYQARHHRSLESDIEKETSSHFRLALLSILRGPLQDDVYSLNKALKGAGTNEALLNDVLVARSNADMHAIKSAYQHTYKRSLDTDVRQDLSAKTERLFAMILAATRQEDSAPFIQQQVQADVTELHRAIEGKAGTDQLIACSILTNRNDGHLRAIAHQYDQTYRTALEKVIQKQFSGHMKDTLVQIMRTATDRVMRDAVALEETMKGMGTKDEMLVRRVVALHWDRGHMAQVGRAYRAKFGKDLVGRIRGETSGDYMRVLVAMVEV